MTKYNYRYIHWFIAIVVFFSATLTYYPGLNGPFVFDDYPNIIDNKLIWNLQETHDLESLRAATFSSGSGLLQRPLSMFSFAFNIMLFGKDPYSFKVTNLVIHLINGGLVFALSLLLLKAYRRLLHPQSVSPDLYWIAFATTAAWLLLPVNLTAILYVVQRMASLSTLFLLLGLIVYVRSRLRLLEGQPAYSNMLIGIIFFGALSVLSKESGALLPVYLFVVEGVLFQFKNHRGNPDKALILLYLFCFFIPGVIGLYWLVTQKSFMAFYEGRLFDLPQRLLTETRVVLLYIKWILLPTPQELTLYHDDFDISQSLFNPVTTFFSILTILGLLATAFLQRKSRPLIALGIFWFFGGHLMESTILPLELVFEHRNYLPSFGVLIAAFSLLILSKTASKLKKIIKPFIVGIIVIYAGITWLRANDWQDIVTLTAQEAHRNPTSPRISYDLGKLYGNLVTDANSEYVPLAYSALEKAAATQNSTILPEIALIILSYKIKNPIESRWYENMEQKLRSRPITFGDISALESFVKCTTLKGCQPENERIMRLFAAALESPNLSKRPRMQALLLSKYAVYLINVLGYFDLAKSILEQLIVLAPEDLPYRITLIRVLLALNDKPAAIIELDKLRALDKQKIFFKDIQILSEKIEFFKQNRSTKDNDE